MLGMLARVVDRSGFRSHGRMTGAGVRFESFTIRQNRLTRVSTVPS
jgi:hypothetical protein